MITPNLASASYILEHPSSPKASACLFKAILNMSHEELQAFHVYLESGSYLNA